MTVVLIDGRFCEIPASSWATAWETWIDPSSNQDVDVHNDNVRLADINGMDSLIWSGDKPIVLVLLYVDSVEE